MTQLLSSAYWALPHDLRRSLSKLSSPTQYRKRCSLRQQGQNGVGLEPLDRHHAIFVHIPKAAGTSIVKSLFGCEGGWHMTLRQYSLIYSAEELNAAFKFTFVRNPWDRLYSAFSYLKAGGRNQADRQWAEQHLARVADFPTFVHEWLPRVDLESSYTHLIPQYRFLRIQGDTPRVDFIGRFETIADDYETIRARIGTGEPLAHLNPSSRAHDYRDVYTEDMKQIVAQAYHKDISLFHYTFEGFTTT
ncbi:sulfotransferase family 2 domain-containing protein [Tautonia marina]|uniref:sulfotransferase family 2 domain-containing protein n=1 Tax=Tautonia marina TaxID=2653855 RepID=UPI001260573B|nr:sulfotransferase family 2 domain-containing protein [Tautonia marina]